VASSEAWYLMTAVHAPPAQVSSSEPEAVEVVVLPLLEPQPVTAKATPARAAIAITG
jgi:hypothetical protein